MFYSDARPATNTTATPHFSNIALRDVLVLNAVQNVNGSKAVPGWAGG